MESYNLAVMTKRIYDSKRILFYLKTLRDILNIPNESTFQKTIKRLCENKIIEKMERDKYVLADSNVNDFSLAYMLYQPSYISFESALNLYGILSQFPYEVSSATVRKSKTKIYDGKIYVYSHIQKSLFWGYEKKDSYLIAVPEKALLDQIYLSSKGYKKINIEEYALNKIDRSRFNMFADKYPKTRQMQQVITTVGSYLPL